MKTLKQILLEQAPQTGKEVVHHISPYDVDDFHPFSHFGTYRAARAVGSYLHGTARADQKEREDEYNTPYKERVAKRPAYRERFHYKARLVNMGNTHHFGFDSTEHNPDSIIRDLHNDGVFSQQEHELHKTELKNIHQETGTSEWAPSLEAKQYAAKVIREKGIHSLSYRNDFEHPGKKSYMITDPSQVKVLKKTPIEVRSSLADKTKNDKPARPRGQIIWHGR